MTLTDHTKKMGNNDIGDFVKNIRKTNYRLGISRNCYTSEAKQRYVHHKDVENVVLNEKKQADLRKHHFILGYKDYDTGTEYGGNFLDKKKRITAAQKQKLEDRKKFLRQHNFNLGAEKTSYKSSYVLDFESKRVDGREQAKKDITNRIKQLRASKVSVGTQRNNWTTKQGEDFNDKTEFVDRSNMFDMNTTKSSLRMGIDKNNWKSQAKAQFVAKEFSNFATDFNKKQVLDLRNAHFGLGNQGNHYDTLNKDSFKEPSQTANTGQNPLLQKSHIRIGDRGRTDYRTEASANFNKKKPIPIWANNNLKLDRCALLFLGTDKTAYETETGKT
jgi:hypothetical protein